VHSCELFVSFWVPGRAGRPGPGRAGSAEAAFRFNSNAARAAARHRRRREWGSWLRRLQQRPLVAARAGTTDRAAISDPAYAYVYVLKISCYIACIGAHNMHTYIQCICIPQNAYVSMCMYCMHVYVCVHMYTPKCICQYCMYCLYVYVCVHM
jgi:hypothetical protein